MNGMTRKLRILFLCTGNSCRSQMAEGWTRHLKGDLIDVVSAGVAPGSLDPRAVAVMKEAGVDISGQQPTDVRDVLDRRFDAVITVCDNAREACPIFPGRALVHHQNFEDPPRLAAKLVEEEAALDVYRRIRDEIRQFVETLPGSVISED